MKILQNLKKSFSAVGAVALFAQMLFMGATPVMAAESTVCASGCSYTTIQAAVTAAASGDTISVAAGTYAEVGQIVINKNLTIVGADKATTIIKATADTGNSGDAKGWWLVSPGYTFNLSGVTLDGNGYQILQGIRHKGVGTIQNVHFTDIRYNQSGPDYAGFAIYAFGQVGAVNVSNSAFDNIGREGIAYWGSGTTGTFTGNTYTGKGLGDWLDYAVEVTNGAVVTITSNTITNNRGTATSDGSDSAGIIVLNDGSYATLAGNTITGNTIGIKVGYNSPSSSAEAHVHQNNISGNYTYDAAAGAGANFDATQNYWGSASPDFATIMTGTVNYDPWYVDAGKTTLSSTIDAIFDSVSSALSAQGVVSNIGNVTASNFTSFSGLYFEKRTDIANPATALGKITFSLALDLSDSATITFLTNLGTELDITNGHISLNTTTSAMFQAAGATLEMYGLPAGVTLSQLIVRDDAGNILDPTGIVSGFTQDPLTHNIIFTTAHFTQFDIDTTAPVKVVTTAAPITLGNVLTPVVATTLGTGDTTPGNTTGSTTDGVVQGAQIDTGQTNTNNDNNNNGDTNSWSDFFNYKVLGVDTWIWLMFIALGIGGWLYLAGRRKQE